MIFAALKVKACGKKGAKAGWRVEMGRPADLLPLWSLEGWKQQLHQCEQMLPTLFFGSTLPVCPLLFWSSSHPALQGSGVSKVSRRTRAVSLLQAVCCPRRPSTSPWSRAGLHLGKEIASPCEPYLCCISATRANLINTEETSWEQLSARIDLTEERENYNQYFRIIWGKCSRYVVMPE